MTWILFLLGAMLPLKAKKGDSLSADLFNRIYEAIRKASKITGSAPIEVSQDSGGTIIRLAEQRSPMVKGTLDEPLTLNVKATISIKKVNGDDVGAKADVWCYLDLPDGAIPVGRKVIAVWDNYDRKYIVTATECDEDE